MDSGKSGAGYSSSLYGFSSGLENDRNRSNTYVYTGNVHDPQGGTTFCSGCGTKLIVRDWYVINTWNLTDEGSCPDCGKKCNGVFDGHAGNWGARRMPVRLSASL